jgi:quinol---cytochrome c reductase iron-sulfur subunit, bacillus type
MSSGCPNCPEGGRRDFFKKAFTAFLGVVLGLVPLASGLMMYFDPLRRKAAGGGFVRVTTLDSLPADGIPRKFQVLATRVDAWNKFAQAPIGAVYLRRTSDDKIEALNVVCPHAGCFVDFLPERGSYLCPCHNSTFTVTGSIADRSSPSARALDSLEVELKGGNEVWVKFQNFQAGRAEKIPIA